MHLQNKKKTISFKRKQRLSHVNNARKKAINNELGTGKTYAACCLAQLYLMESYKILYLSKSLNAVNNFNSEKVYI